MKSCETYFKNAFSKNYKALKNTILAEDFNISFPDCEMNKIVQKFLNLRFRNNMITTTNKPTRVTRNAGNHVDHIITNCIISHTDFKTEIIKTALTDHFPIVFAFKTNEETQEPREEYISSFCKVREILNY